jgi:hypothetical protein
MLQGGGDGAHSFAGFCTLGRRQREAELGAAPRRPRAEVQRAAVLFDHRAAQAQAQAHAFGLGREEGREELGRRFGRDAGPASMTLKTTQRGCVCRTRSVSTRSASARAGFHRLDAVAREVEQHLLQHGAVAAHARRFGRQVQFDARAALARLQAHQGQHGLDQRVVP